MLRITLSVLTVLLLALAVTAAIVEATQDHGHDGFADIGTLWWLLAPTSLQVAEAAVSRYLDPCGLIVALDCTPFLWYPIITTILLIPALPFFLLTGIALAVLNKYLRMQDGLHGWEAWLGRWRRH